MFTDANEPLPIVDENDIEVGTAQRKEVHRRAWRHRAVHIVVVNSRDQVLLQRRSLVKDTYPGYWDVSVGGHVGVGEAYEDAARRELKEELGVDGALAYRGKIAASAATNWEFVEVYTCRHEGPFQIHPDEITEVVWMDLDDVLNRAALERSWPITRSAIHTFRFWSNLQDSQRSCQPGIF